jgi:hypothetical protein
VDGADTATRLIGHTHYEHIPFVSVQVPSHAKGGAHVMDQRALIIIAIAAVVAIGAYFAFTGGYFNQTKIDTIQQTARSDLKWPRVALLASSLANIELRPSHSRR